MDNFFLPKVEERKKNSQSSFTISISEGKLARKSLKENLMEWIIEKLLNESKVDTEKSREVDFGGFNAKAQNSRLKNCEKGWKVLKIWVKKIKIKIVKYFLK